VGDLKEWGNLGATAILGIAFLVVIVRVMQSAATDRATFWQVISGHLAHNTEATIKHTEVLDVLVDKVNHIDRDHLDRQ